MNQDYKPELFKTVPGLDPDAHFWQQVDSGLLYLDQLQGMSPAEKDHFRYHPAYWNWYLSLYKSIDKRIIHTARAEKTIVSIAQYREVVIDCFSELYPNKELINIILKKPFTKTKLSWTQLF
jgi:hypothetical protein